MCLRKPRYDKYGFLRDHPIFAKGDFRKNFQGGTVIPIEIKGKPNVLDTARQGDTLMDDANVWLVAESGRVVCIGGPRTGDSTTIGYMRETPGNYPRLRTCKCKLVVELI